MGKNKENETKDGHTEKASEFTTLENILRLFFTQFLHDANLFGLSG